MTEEQTIRHYLGYYENSPSCLRWRVSRGTKTKAGDTAGFINERGHWIVHITINGKIRQYRCTWIVWLLRKGQWPTNKIYHKNGNGQDNRIANLLERRLPAGVYWNSTQKRFLVKVNKIYVGRYLKVEQAIDALNAYRAKIKTNNQPILE